MNKAVFLDRDGVLNPLVFNPDTCAYEAPHRPEDFSVFTYTARSLKLLRANGFLNIVISNQPDLAKGKATADDLQKIAVMISDYTKENGNLVEEFCYCYHHPDGIVEAYTQECLCRKPGTLFIESAIRKYDLDRTLCFMIGDRKSDMICGKNAGVRTIRIVANNKQDYDIDPGQICVPTLWEAVLLIVKDLTQ